MSVKQLFIGEGTKVGLILNVSLVNSRSKSRGVCPNFRLAARPGSNLRAGRFCILTIPALRTQNIMIEHQPGDTYIVSGYYYNSDRKFRDHYNNPHQALGINLWRGRVWQVRNGRRKLIKKVWN